MVDNTIVGAGNGGTPSTVAKALKDATTGELFAALSERTCTVQEAAAKLDKEPHFVRSLCRTGQLLARQLPGETWLIDRKSVNEYRDVATEVAKAQSGLLEQIAALQAELDKLQPAKPGRKAATK
jgi:hypothetical protein